MRRANKSKSIIDWDNFVKKRNQVTMSLMKGVSVSIVGGIAGACLLTGFGKLKAYYITRSLKKTVIEACLRFLTSSLSTSFEIPIE